MVSALIILAVIFPSNIAEANTIYDNTNGEINQTTIITKENIKEVVEYLGLPTDSIVDNNSSKDYGNVTVGELHQLIINSSNQMAKKFISTEQPSIQKPSFNLNAVYANSSSKTLSTSFNNDGYVIELSVTGQYSGTKWTGVGGISADVDSGQLIIVYKISDKDLSGTYTASCITVSGSIYVDSYVGVGDFALVKIGSAQKNTIRAYFYASKYL